MDLDVARNRAVAAAVRHHLDDDRHLGIGQRAPQRGGDAGAVGQRDPQRIDGFDGEGKLGSYHGRYPQMLLLNVRTTRAFAAQSRFAFFDARRTQTLGGREYEVVRLGLPLLLILLRDCFEIRCGESYGGGFENRSAADIWVRELSSTATAQ